MLRKPTIDPAMFWCSVTYIISMPDHCVRHWPTFKRHWAGVYTMCTHYRQHEVLTRAEWILANTGDTANVSV